jgi:hypothetical protein
MRIATPETAKLLDITTRTAFVRAEDGIFIGTLDICFSITNRSGFAAVSPFIAFSLLGLRVVQEPDWIMQTVTTRAGKRLIRFLNLKQPVLEPGETVSPCSLKLVVTASAGGGIIVSRSIERSLHDVSDFRIPLQAGAGNFSPESSTVAISGRQLATLARTALASRPRAEDASPPSPGQGFGIAGTAARARSEFRAA